MESPSYFARPHIRTDTKMALLAIEQVAYSESGVPEQSIPTSRLYHLVGLYSSYIRQNKRLWLWSWLGLALTLTLALSIRYM